jgi:hypothetical protein
MACLVGYCPHPSVDEGELCAKHQRAWAALGPLPHDVAKEMAEPWLKEQSDLILDVCPTPVELALAICTRLEETVCRDHYLRDPLRVFEPSAGDGAFVKAAHAIWPTAHIEAVEIREACGKALVDAGARIVWHGDLTTYADPVLLEGIGSADLVVGNPPFAVAEEHIRFLLKNMKEGAYLAFLLRVGFYGSKERLDFWTEHPEVYFAPIVPRPGFKLNAKGKPGTDSQEYGLFVWRAGPDDGVTSPLRMPHLVWQKKRATAVKPIVVEAPELE